METETEEINTTGRDGLCRLIAGYSYGRQWGKPKETSGRKMEVMSAKTKTVIGLIKLYL